MNLRLSMVFRPSSIVILLASAALIVPISLTPCWYAMVKRIEQRVHLNSQVFLSDLQSEIEDSAKLIRPMDSSSINLARLLSSNLIATKFSFSEIETKVAPALFQAFETVPHLAEISYIGMEGLFFSYYTDHDLAFAMYSNSSFSSAWGASNYSTLYYIQPVNRDTGELYGQAVTSERPSINASWIQEAVNSSYGYASMRTMWSNGHDLLFLSSARITGAGFVSLGFPATSITDFVTRIGVGRQGVCLYLSTKGGRVLVEGIQHTHMVFSDDMVSFQSLKPNGDPVSYEGTVSCKDEAVASVVNILGTQYLLYCSSIDIMGVESVYVLAIPQNGLVSLVHKSRKQGLTLLSVMMVMIIFSIFSFLFINGRAARREMLLCASLIKQMEATQQEERKSMNKSRALASASHDIRASLAGLTGLIEMSYDDVVPGSELETNLKQMDSCTEDLLKLLNSILDTSKIEAGKMQLVEEEFDLSQLVEDEVDLCHPVALKKGVDLVLDPCNGSVIRFSRVKGDKGKLKRVLSNLLSNAVKYTDEGHIAVRAWAQKPSFQISVASSNRYSFMKHLSCLFCRENVAHKDIEVANAIQQDPNCMDFVFEVDDTGRGIPKEKQMSVFENYVQVKETAIGQVGTGLGLGIVQSLVRLMHGDIGIVGKDMGEKGTCFRFNVILTVSERVTGGSTRDRNQPQGLTIHTPSPKLPIRTSSPGTEASRVVLLIQEEERRRTSQKFMVSLGIKVKVVKQWEQLFYTLKKIKQKGDHSNQSSPGASDLSSGSKSQNSIGRAEGVPSSAMDGTDYRTDIGAATGFVLIVIDAKAGPFVELCKMVSDFRRGLSSPCKVVWLDKPLVRSVNFKALDEDMFDPDDVVISKPFHGTRLLRVIKLLPEYSSSSRGKRESAHDSSRGERFCNETQVSFGDQSSKARDSPVHEGAIQECDASSFDKVLSGKKFLVVEDAELLRKLALAALIKLGASVEQCQNGEEAVKLVEEGLSAASPHLPYDYILMDCEMPVMDGFEATRRIRAMEKAYGVHIPIFALTAHTSGNETKMTIEAGMDIHMGKPIRKEHLLEAIRCIHSKE